MSDTPPLAAAPLPSSRDRTPELTTKREKRHRDDAEDDRDDRHGRSRRHGSRDPERERERDDYEREREERRRRRENETEEEREERHRRRRRERELRDREHGYDRDHERDRDRDDRSQHDRDRDRDYERDRTRDHDRDHRRDDRDRDYDRTRGRDRDHDRERRRDSRADRERSHDSRTASQRGASPRRDKSREERERERARRDEEMREERREMARRRDDRDRRSYDNSPRPRDSPARRPPPPREEAEMDPVDKLLAEVDQEKRSIFISQIANALTSADLGLFFEDKLGRGSVTDARVVTDKGSKRSKGIGYVELASTQLLSRALALSGTIVMGIPIIIQLAEAERNREGLDFNALVAKAQESAKRDRDRERERERERERDRPRYQQLRFPPLSTGLALPPGLDVDAHAGASIPYHRLFVTGLAHSLSADDLFQVFEPFGAIEFIDLHLDFHGQSKGTAYVQFRDLSAAQMALDAMDHFELAGQAIKVQTVPERITHQDRIEETGRSAPRLDATARQQLMYKLARTEMPDEAAKPVRPSPMTNKAAPPRPSPYIVVGNMFNPEEETERNWDLDLAEDVKGECERKYGKVDRIKVDKMSAGEVYIEFSSLDGSDRALKGLNGRFFGGRQLTVTYISEALFKAHM
ncbi:Phosphatidylinositol-3-phosphatase SAC1 [Cryptotrichosporon argae]